jgi:hypothetical protein
MRSSWAGCRLKSTQDGHRMLSYYLFMALLITTLVLWGIVALKDDGYEEPDESKDQAETPAEPAEENK